MKLNNKFISTTYDLDKGSELQVISSHENDAVVVKPNSELQGGEEVKSRILKRVETSCTTYRSGDEINVQLRDFYVVAADVVHHDDDKTVITLKGDDRHGLVITIHGSK